MRVNGVVAVIAIVGFGGLAGCSVDDFIPDEGDDGVEEYNEAFAEGTALRSDIGATALNNPATLPTTGMATYFGDARIAVDNDSQTDILGRMMMNVGFEGGTVDGTIDSFINESGEYLDGSLAIDGAVDDAMDGDSTDPAIVATLSGTLTDPDDVTYGVTGGLAGNFYGADQLYVGGALVGDACTTEGCLDLTGSFAGSRGTSQGE